MKLYDGERLPNPGNIVVLANSIVILYQVISRETELQAQLHDAAELLMHWACFISSDSFMASKSSLQEKSCSGLW